jgi:hypothetical protein
VITLATLLITAPSTAPAPSGSVGGNPPVVGAGGEHYGEGWNNYGHDVPLPQPARTGAGADSAVARHADVVAADQFGR